MGRTADNGEAAGQGKQGKHESKLSCVIARVCVCVYLGCNPIVDMDKKQRNALKKADEEKEGWARKKKKWVAGNK